MLWNGLLSLFLRQLIITFRSSLSQSFLKKIHGARAILKKLWWRSQSHLNFWNLSRFIFLRVAGADAVSNLTGSKKNVIFVGFVFQELRGMACLGLRSIFRKENKLIINIGQRQASWSCQKFKPGRLDSHERKQSNSG